MNSQALYRSFEVTLVELDDGVLVVRGSTEVQIQGSIAKAFVEAILEATSGDIGVTFDDVMSLFPEPAQEFASTLFDRLVSRNILVDQDHSIQPTRAMESPLDIFRWELSLTEEDAIREIDSASIVVIGKNYISMRFCEAVESWGLGDLIKIIDDPWLRSDAAAARWPDKLGNVFADDSWENNLPETDVAVVVAATEAGATEILRDVNRACFVRKFTFLPISMKRTVGFVGPMVFPGETPCYECLYARENANIEKASVARAAEQMRKTTKRLPGFIPSMASVLGDVAGVQFIQLISKLAANGYGNMLEVNLLVPELVSHAILKVPRCQLCGPKEYHPGLSALSKDLIVLPESYREQ